MTVRVRFLVLLLLAALTLAGGCGQRSWQSGGVRAHCHGMAGIRAAVHGGDNRQGALPG